MCSDHFVSCKPSQQYEVNNEDWAPSQNLGYDRLSERASRAVARTSRKRLRMELQLQESARESDIQPEESHHQVLLVIMNLKLVNVELLVALASVQLCVVRTLHNHFSLKTSKYY